MADLRVLHVLPRWNAGGAVRDVLIQARRSLAANRPVHHEALALERTASAPLLREALRLRLRVRLVPDADTEASTLRGADVVVFHYWNTPEVRRFLNRNRGLHLRWILACPVNGLHAPQKLPPRLLETAGCVVISSPITRPLVPHDRCACIPCLADVKNTACSPPDRRDIPLLHVGTLNVFKLSPAFVPLHSGLFPTGTQVVVAGAGGDEPRFQAEARALGCDDGFQWSGFISNPTTLYDRSRVMTYPLSKFTYAAACRVVQEAQCAGTPVITFTDSPVAHLIRHGETGWLAEGLPEYRTALEALACGDLILPSPSQVQRSGMAQHAPETKCAALEALQHERASAGATPLDDGFVEDDDWVAWQTNGIALPPVECRSPALSLLARDDGALLSYQFWACEGGLAHFLNAGFSLPNAQTRARYRP